MTKKQVGGGWGIGSVIAVALSIIVNKSVGWAIVHLLCGWFYVIWVLIVHLDKIKHFFNNI